MKRLDLKNFTVADAPFNGGIMAIIGVFMAAGFSFQGTELLGVAAGETSDPERNIPKAIRSIFLAYSFILYPCNSRYRFINSLYN